MSGTRVSGQETALQGLAADRRRNTQARFRTHTLSLLHRLLDAPYRPSLSALDAIDVDTVPASTIWVNLGVCVLPADFGVRSVIFTGFVVHIAEELPPAANTSDGHRRYTALSSLLIAGPNVVLAADKDDLFGRFSKDSILRRIPAFHPRSPALSRLFLLGLAVYVSFRRTV